MLRDGRFIKEPPPRIGCFYVPAKPVVASPEEAFIQNVVLGNRQDEHSFLSKVLGFMLRL